MKLIHRIGLSASDSQLCQLASLGVKYETVMEQRSGTMIVFLVDEEDASWPSVSSLITEWKAPDLAYAEFSRHELANSQYVRMGPEWHHGYPQPEDGYEHTTYDSSGYCSQCKMGLKQQAPFRMCREPKWGRRQILQLNWVMGEFFVTPEAWESVFKPFGIDCLPVMQHKGGRPLKTALQLEITAWTSSVDMPDGYVAERCGACMRESLALRSPGRFPHVDLPENVHIARTPEYFGGGVPWHEVIISASLYTAIMSHNLRGATFEVVAAPGQPRR